MRSKRDCVVLYREESRSDHANDVLGEPGVLWIDLCLFVSMLKSMPSEVSDCSIPMYLNAVHANVPNVRSSDPISTQTNGSASIPGP
jgi:hypothetical protein